MNIAFEKQAIVFDVGTGTCKAGLAGESSPSVLTGSVIGKPRFQTVMRGMLRKDYYVGEEALSASGVLSLSYLLKPGVFFDWDIMENIWHHTFSNDLRIAPTEHAILLTEATVPADLNRKRTAEIMFEKFQVPVMGMAVQPVLSLYASGRTSGIVLESGESVSCAVPIIEGEMLKYAKMQLNLAGRHITEQLLKILPETEKVPRLSSTGEREIVRKMKEKYGDVALNFAEDSRRADRFREAYTLPDGQSLEIGRERYSCTEILFKPSLCGLDTGGIHKKVHASIFKCGSDIRKDLISNIILSGGSTMFPGFAARLQKEMELQVQGLVKVIALPERRYSSWVGGSVLASLSTFKDSCISKSEYEELGGYRVYCS